MDCGAFSNLFVRIGCYLNNIHVDEKTAWLFLAGFTALALILVVRTFVSEVIIKPRRPDAPGGLNVHGGKRRRKSGRQTT